MKKERINKPEIKLAGLSIRTNTQNEMTPQTAKIKGLIEQFKNESIAEQITNRIHPGICFAVYTDYESDEHGDYTYFIGEQVDSFEGITSHLQQLVIPPSTYQKFTTSYGPMPEVVINAWQHIWQMSPDELGGKRIYVADFEVYDERASDPSKTCLDIYIGIK